jgi:hypothetical protein
MTLRTLACILLLIAPYCAFGERYALLVGNSSAKGDFAPLKYVQNDLNALSDILTDFCGFAREHVVTLYNQTPEELDRALADFSSNMAGLKDNMFVLYYSGHADVANLKMGDNNYPLVRLKEKLTGFPSDIRIGIFDACQSGSFTRIKGGRLDEPFLFRDDSKTKGQVILCSSSINENAQESDLYGNSIFTFHFVNALRGSGDMAGDGRVTLGEAYQYAYNYTLSSTAGTSGGIQHPSFQFRIQGEGDIVLADLNIRTRGILLSGDVYGDITIFSNKGTVVADLSKKANTSVMIALKPGAYKVVSSRDDQKYQTKKTVGEKSVVTVKHADFSAIESSPATKKGDNGLRGAQIGVTLSGGYGGYDLSVLSTGLTKRFEGYGAFSISPVFSYPKYLPAPLLIGEVIIRKRFEIHLGFGYYTTTSTEDYSGMQFNRFDKSSYAARLQVRRSLNVPVIDFGCGYRFQQPLIKNLSLHLGIALYLPVLEMSSVFYDSLYDREISGSARYNCYAIVPFAAVGYTWPATKWLDIGAKIRYRYQVGAGNFTADTMDSRPVPSGDAPPLLACNFGGIDGGVFVNFHLSFSRSE